MAIVERCPDRKTGSASHSDVQCEFRYYRL